MDTGLCGYYGQQRPALRWKLDTKGIVDRLTTFSASLLFTMVSSADFGPSRSSVPFTLHNTRGSPLPGERRQREVYTLLPPDPASLECMHSILCVHAMSCTFGPEVGQSGVAAFLRHRAGLQLAMVELARRKLTQRVHLQSFRHLMVVITEHVINPWHNIQ